MNASIGRWASKLNRAGASWRPDVRLWGGRFSATSFDRLLYLYLHKCRVMGTHHHARLARLIRPGMTVVDVGANLGLYTFVLSRLVGDTGRVVSFEPEPDLFLCLQRNCEMNGLRNVVLHNVAVGDQRGTATLIRSPLHSGDSRVRAGDAGAGHTVPVVTLDDVLGDTRPDLLKIDVQGYELKVLRGMTRILQSTPSLRIDLEFWPFGIRSAGDDPIDVLTLLRSQSFVLFADERGAERPIADPAAFTDQIRGKAFADVFAVRHAPAAP